MAKTYFFWDPVEDNIVQEYDEAGTITAEYTTEPDLHANVISQRRQAQHRQFHYDAQGSTLAVTDDNQNVTDTFAYTAFGEVTERTGNTEVSFQYMGQKGYYRDGLTGQYLVRHRVYDTRVARWLSVDPISDGFSTRPLHVESIGRHATTMFMPTLARFAFRDPLSPDGVNLLDPPPVIDPYRYVQNIPVNYVDPSGQFPAGEGEECESKNPCKVTTLERTKGAKCPDGYTPYTFKIVASGSTTTKDMGGKCEGGDDCKGTEKCTFETYERTVAGAKITEARCRCIAAK